MTNLFTESLYINCIDQSCVYELEYTLMTIIILPLLHLFNALLKMILNVNRKTNDSPLYTLYITPYNLLKFFTEAAILSVHGQINLRKQHV